MAVASIEENDTMQPPGFEERQKLRDLEDLIIDTTSVLESTKDTTEALFEKYNQFRRDFSNEFDDADFDPIDLALQEKQRDVVTYRKKVDVLRVKVKSTIELVSGSRFL